VPEAECVGRRAFAQHNASDVGAALDLFRAS
jgi:hypothetical protein